MRVYRNAQSIAKKEKASMKLVLTAALLHDIVSYPKSDHRSKTASIMSAVEASRILKRYGYAADEIKVITEAIRDHSFSRGAIPQTLEGKILQDADRLDATGAIGIARTFSVGGAEQKTFNNNEDKFYRNRIQNDTNAKLIHYSKKHSLLEMTSITKT